MKQIRKIARGAKRYVAPSRDDSGIIGNFWFAHGFETATRISLCNHLISRYGYKSFLEIGTRNKEDMNNRILAERRASVDPDPNAAAEYEMTSDDYFAQHDERFDLIFIDGLHTGEQVRKDIENSLKVLNPNGAILLHDLNPPTAFHAREDYEVDGTFPMWNGTSWEGYAWYRKHDPNLEMYVVDVDWGVGFIRPGRQDTWSGPVQGYDSLEQNRTELLNLISVKDFLKRHK